MTFLKIVIATSAAALLAASASAASAPTTTSDLPWLDVATRDRSGFTDVAQLPVIDRAPGPVPVVVVAADGSADFRTISEAVIAASPGDTILVTPGTYGETIVIDKDISVRGLGPRHEIIVASPMGPAVVFDLGNASVGRLTLDGGQSPVVVEGGTPVLSDLALEIG